VTDTDIPQNAFTTIYRDASGAEHFAASPLSDAHVSHWAMNIILWSSYLPHDCVKTMIRMGWHRST
jgi:hypothetical protein